MLQHFDQYLHAGQCSRFISVADHTGACSMLMSTRLQQTSPEMGTTSFFPAEIVAASRLLLLYVSNTSMYTYEWDAVVVAPKKVTLVGGT